MNTKENYKHMHFVDRDLFRSAPITALRIFHTEEQPKWLLYKNFLINKTPPVVRKPEGKWTRDVVRDPLILLFKSNCAYCGDFAQKNNDGEVDHFFPKELDSNAENIYSWDNLVWACHSCNNKKRANFPLLNPCNNDEMEKLYFHSSSGCYVLYSDASNIIVNKHELTEKYTYMNGKMSPQRRRSIKNQLEILYLKDILTKKEIYELEQTIDPNSDKVIALLEELELSKDKLRDFLTAMDYMQLKLKVFSDFKTDNPEFSYEISEFL